jgi:hypothetical protein
MRFTAALLTLPLLFMLISPAVSVAAPTLPLGAARSFAVLAHSAITNTGPSVIRGSAGGDIGVSAGTLTSITGFPPGTHTGTAHGGDLAAQNAMSAAGAAYLNATDSVARPFTEDLTGQVLGSGGTVPTLGPGVYSFSSSAQLTGTLTLDAGGDPDAVFIFRMGSTLNTASSSRVLLAGGARPCRVFWAVGSSATLGTDTEFVGHIFAVASITANTNATVAGQLLAMGGAVTLDHNIIDNRACATLHVIKQVINDDGRTSVAADFNVHVTASGIDVHGSPAPGAGSPGTTYTLDAGTYAVSEDATSAYTASYSGGGIDPITGAITLAADDNVTVTITNNDVAPTATPIIHITKAANPTALPFGPGSVTYTYTVTNPGTVPLIGVTVTDDKLGPVTNRISGDLNGNGLLDPGETWIYTATTTLSATTTNAATATGSGNQATATDTALITVVVTQRTITGGQIPRTATPWYNVLLAGVALTLLGAAGLWRSTIKIHG